MKRGRRFVSRRRGGRELHNRSVERRSATIPSADGVFALHSSALSDITEAITRMKIAADAVRRDADWHQGSLSYGGSDVWRESGVKNIAFHVKQLEKLRATLAKLTYAFD